MRLLSGIELVDVEEVRSILEKDGENYIRENFTDAEREYCESRKKMRHEHYAGRIAAKRAFLKAMGEEGLALKEIEFFRDKGRAPELHLSDSIKSKTGIRPEDKILVSLAHERKLAVATVVVVKDF